MATRTVQPDDYTSVHNVIDAWWGGRKMAHLLPRLFFEHFQSTSFVVEVDGELRAFLIGFLSQTNLREAYIHFIGVHPNYRKTGFARHLYEQFFATVQNLGRDRVRCITSPVNKTSVAFHRRMGFSVETVPDYEGPGQDRIVFLKQLTH